NDSGASAYEIDTNQYLLDFERSFTELVPDSSSHKIIATSYSNYAMFFIRYDTGDSALVDSAIVRNKKTLTKVLGKSSETLEINGFDISVPRLAVLLGDLTLERYQIIKHKNTLEFCYTGKLSKEDEN